jgi:nitric oxide reductase NorD protein
MSEHARLRAEQLEERLEEHVDAVLSSRRTAAGPARQLADFSRVRQEFVLRWVDVLARTNAEMAFQFATHAATALRSIVDEPSIEAWVIDAVDVFDKKGLSAGIAALRAVDEFARNLERMRSGLALEDVRGVLERYLRGLSGRSLHVDAANRTYTDTETLFLPAVESRLPLREENFLLYKAMVTHQWAQTWYGTWRIGVAERLSSYPDPKRAARIFHALETLRLDACIERELPGVFRDLRMLRERLDPTPLSPEWCSIRGRLTHHRAGVKDSLDLLDTLYLHASPAPVCYQGAMFPERVAALVAARVRREKEAFRRVLAQIEGRRLDQRPDTKAQPDETLDANSRVDVRKVSPANDAQGVVYELFLDGQPIAPPDEAQGLMESIVQDFGEIPDDYLVAAGPGAYNADADPRVALDPKDVWKGTYHEEGAFLYDEWDADRKHYRKDWCVLRELDVHPRAIGFVERTLRRHSGLVKSLRRTFEALRGEEKLLKRQPEGEDIDIDAVVEAFADSRAGLEMTNRLFNKMRREERNIAVMFMVDMSGSTKGWINDAEREALVLLCEAVESLGDRYAIYGFSGMTRKRCEVYRVKRFEDTYDDRVRARISGIRPQDYTRMGVAIRHLCALLHGCDSRTKLLVTLSDGKPDDYDSYRGVYGIEDTRKALFEARSDGIHPFCVTIDEEARDYLPHMYGAANYVVLDEVRKLPLKISDIYRRLTT